MAQMEPDNERLRSQNKCFVLDSLGGEELIRLSAQAKGLMKIEFCKEQNRGRIGWTQVKS